MTPETFAEQTIIVHQVEPAGGEPERRWQVSLDLGRGVRLPMLQEPLTEELASFYAEGWRRSTAYAIRRERARGRGPGARRVAERLFFKSRMPVPPGQEPWTVDYLLPSKGRRFWGMVRLWTAEPADDPRGRRTARRHSRWKELFARRLEGATGAAALAAATGGGRAEVIARRG